MAPIGAKRCQNAFQTIPVVSIFGEKQNKSARFFGLENRFTPFWTNFGGSTDKRTSKSTSSQFFALDALIMRSVRPKNVKNMSVGAPESGTCRRYPPPNIPPPYCLELDLDSTYILTCWFFFREDGVEPLFWQKTCILDWYPSILVSNWHFVLVSTSKF